MDSSQLLGDTTFVCLAAILCYTVVAFFKIKRVGILGAILTIAGILLNTSGIGLHWIETYQSGIGYVPLSNMYESLVFFALSISTVYLVVEYCYKTRFLGSFVMPYLR